MAGIALVTLLWAVSVLFHPPVAAAWRHVFRKRHHPPVLPPAISGMVRELDFVFDRETGFYTCGHFPTLRVELGSREQPDDDFVKYQVWDDHELVCFDRGVPGTGKFCAWFMDDLEECGFRLHNVLRVKRLRALAS